MLVQLVFQLGAQLIKALFESSGELQHILQPRRHQFRDVFATSIYK